MTKVTFCITCYDKDVHLLDRSISFAENQTVRPDEILVVSSGLNKDYHIILGRLRNRGISTYNSVERKLPGWARNTGGLFAKGDVICFCDVDDDIHPQKCEIIKQVFSKSEVSGFVHNYYTPKTWWDNGWEQLEGVDIEEITKIESDHLPEKWHDTPRTNVMTDNHEPVCHGHLSCRKEIFDHLQYDENMSLGEDGTFCQGIVNHSDFRLFYSNKKLIIYN
jgi:glycosyltransferase involved in cell wall biosynthesis